VNDARINLRIVTFGRHLCFETCAELP